MPSQSELMPPGVEDLFTDTRYGVSFPDRTGCQMRFVHKGKDLGWYFNYNDYDPPRAMLSLQPLRPTRLTVKSTSGSLMVDRPSSSGRRLARWGARSQWQLAIG